MPIITLSTIINAPIERVFDLSTSIDLHKLSASKTQEQAIAGVTSGLIKLDETVTWKAKHFGIWFKMKVGITAYNRPTMFVDEMLEGNFAFMKHVHEFEQPEPDQTLMKDSFEFRSPFGVFGKVVDHLILKNYLRNFIQERNQVIKKFAETDNWKQVLIDPK